jgi:long-chain acyl-CoA synthetase
MTETSPTISYLPPERHVFDGPLTGKAGSAGQPAYTVDVCITDDAGTMQPRGTAGEICVKGPTVMPSYWGSPDLTAPAFRNGWFRTGDVGRLDEDGYLYVVDRVKDMIISGGENIYSAEVDNILLAHPAVLECGVIGVPDEQWGERVHAVVRLRSDYAVETTELVEHCRSSLARYKCPRSFEIRTEALPRSGVGKILKTELKKQATLISSSQINDLGESRAHRH